MPIQTIEIQGRQIDLLREPYRRSIGLTLQLNGRVRVKAPLSTSLSRIQDFLILNEDWITSHLAKYRILREANPRRLYIEGEVFPLLGRRLKLRFEVWSGNYYRFDVRVRPSQGSLPEQPDPELVVQVPQQIWANGFNSFEPHPEVGLALVETFSRIGKSVLMTRLKLYSKRMGLEPSAVRFRSQKTRWGSCSAARRISLNWRLVFAPIEVIDYVIVHELAHLSHYDHSKRFWALVGSQIPNYLTLRAWLKEHQFDADFLAKRSELYS